MKRKNLISALLMGLLIGTSTAQEATFATELQSTFIDITGLFGVAEPASATTLNYTSGSKKFGLQLYHSFSLERFGRPIQSIVIPSYTFKLKEKLLLKPKVDLAYIAPSGGVFIRPGALLIWKPNPQNIFVYGNWYFADFRAKDEYPRRLNGLTFYSSYKHLVSLRKWQLDFETRLAYVDIREVLQLASVFQNATLKHKKTGLYVGANGVYSFYHSNHLNDLVWNVSLGIERNIRLQNHHTRR